MSRPLQRFAFACLMASAWADAGAQGIYTCVDAKGRRLTADRPIPECADREQKQLNTNGTVRRIVAPVPTAAERAAQEEQQRKLAEERQRQAEEKRVQRLLLARYPHEAAHAAERAKALRAVDDAIASGKRRLEDLRLQRKPLLAESEFYRDPAQWPHKLKRQLDDNDQQLAAQQRFIATQEDEKKRISGRFDEELAQLKLLWAQQATAAVGAAAASAPVRR
jgi:hypothetical protein